MPIQANVIPLRLARTSRWRQFRTPDGLLLYDRRTGLNVLLESFKHQSFDKPLYAQVKVTNKCNLHCSFCSQGSGACFEHEWAFDDLFSLFKYLDGWGLCVHPEETITIKRDGFISLIRIRDARPGDEILSYDISSKLPIWAEIDSVTWRQNTETLRKLVFFPGNRSVTVTRNHLMPTTKRGLVEAGQLSVGEECYAIKSLPERIPTNKQLDLLDFALQLARDDRGTHRYYLMGHGITERIPRILRAKSGTAISISALHKYPDLMNSINLGKARIRRGYSGYTLPVRIPLSRALFRLIGYYLSEGDTRGFTLNAKEEERLEEIQRDYRSVFGHVLGRYKTDSTHSVSLQGNSWFNDFVFCRLLGCGKGAPNKRIPNLAYNVRNEFIIELLRGLMGDGHLRYSRKRLSINYKTTSLELCKGIRLLLLCLGITSSVTSEIGKPRSIEGRAVRLYERRAYCVTVYGRRNVKKLMRVVQLDPRVVKLDLRAKVSKYSNNKYLSDKICVLKSTDVEPPNFVVDLHVKPNSLFVAGDGVVVHNCGIALGGGEPFTFPRLAELVRKTWNETGLDISITSNGLLITEDDLCTLAGNVGEIRVSCWTPNDLRKVKRLLGKGVHIGINTVLFANGMGAVKEIVNSALKIGVDDFLILQCRPQGRAGAELSPSPTDFRELADFVRDLGMNVKVDTGTGLKLKGLLPYTGPWGSDTAGAVICVTEDRCVAPNSFELERKEPITRFDDIKSAYDKWYR